MMRKPRTPSRVKKDKDKMYDRFEDAMAKNTPMSENYRKRMHKIAQYKPAALTYGKKEKTDEERRD